ncbi:unnamed protein product [Acanthoscelides obtectus]|uniref:Poly [ADP-ribose] polymerase n=1 Tax=Acanthoscelides obtectus TaxID=200917 RepID=A0A9P0KJ91_ACAOB|nr:unnamed protein product [Acanthoscelides obtectus]CAK1667714.1 hypothetical protein AOBTE_LOCUS26003 [Acanthoscelides obtectus]
MGGLFSSDAKQPHVDNNARSVFQSIHTEISASSNDTGRRYESASVIRPSTISYTYEKPIPQITYETLCNEFNSFSIRPSYIKKVQLNEAFIKSLSDNVGITDWGICENNFNWRLRGTALGHRFGQGVSFTNISNYATHYGDLKHPRKAMILAQVLVRHTCIGYGGMVIPDEPFDTATNDKGQVFVKFEDNEFYPSYVIYRVAHKSFELEKKE